MFYDHETFPSFIPSHHRDQKSNSELLNTNFYSCFGSDSQMLVYNAEIPNLIIDHPNPNNFDEENIFKNFR